jgi:hypothetical protein
VLDLFLKIGYDVFIARGDTKMELLVVDFGDSYDRSVVGVARDLAEARSMARAYVVSVCWGGVVQDFQYFAVQRHVLGEASVAYVADEELDLSVEG